MIARMRTRLALERPVIDLRIANDGSLEAGVTLGEEVSASNVSVANALIADGSLRLADARSGETFAAELVEVEHVEEVHDPEHEEDDAELGAHEFKGGLRGLRLGSKAQREDDEADVDEVEADHEEVVYGVGHVFASAEGLDEEDTAVAMQGAGDPDGERDAQREIDDVAKDGNIHGMC